MNQSNFLNQFNILNQIFLSQIESNIKKKTFWVTFCITVILVESFKKIDQFVLNRLYFCIDFPFSLLFFCSWRRRQTLLLLLLGEKLKSQVICVQSCCNGVKTQACLTFLMAVFYFVTYNIPCGYCSAAHMNPSPVVKTRATFYGRFF